MIGCLFKYIFSKNLYSYPSNGISHMTKIIRTLEKTKHIEKGIRIERNRERDRERKRIRE